MIGVFKMINDDAFLKTMENNKTCNNCIENIKIDKWILKKIKNLSKKYNISINQVVNDMLMDGLAKNDFDEYEIKKEMGKNNNE